MYYGGRVDIMTNPASAEESYAWIVALFVVFIVLPVTLYLSDKWRDK